MECLCQHYTHTILLTAWFGTKHLMLRLSQSWETLSYEEPARMISMLCHVFLAPASCISGKNRPKEDSNGAKERPLAPKPWCLGANASGLGCQRATHQRSDRCQGTIYKDMVGEFAGISLYEEWGLVNRMPWIASLWSITVGEKGRCLACHHLTQLVRIMLAANTGLKSYLSWRLTPKSAKGPSNRANWATRQRSLLASVWGVL